MIDMNSAGPFAHLDNRSRWRHDGSAGGPVEYVGRWPRAGRTECRRAYELLPKQPYTRGGFTAVPSCPAQDLDASLFPTPLASNSHGARSADSSKPGRRRLNLNDLAVARFGDAGRNHAV